MKAQFLMKAKHFVKVHANHLHKMSEPGNNWIDNNGGLQWSLFLLHDLGPCGADHMMGSLP